jgi:hypothetical protein
VQVIVSRVRILGTKNYNMTVWTAPADAARGSDFGTICSRTDLDPAAPEGYLGKLDTKRCPITWKPDGSHERPLNAFRVALCAQCRYAILAAFPEIPGLYRSWEGEIEFESSTFLANECRMIDI